MAVIALHNHTNSDMLVIPAVFVDKYLPSASGADVKVYLYALRSLQAGTLFSMSSLSDVLDLTEKEVMRALTYWEQCGLLGLSFGSDHNLNAIYFLPADGRPDEGADLVERSLRQLAGMASPAQMIIPDSVLKAVTESAAQTTPRHTRRQQTAPAASASGTGFTQPAASGAEFTQSSASGAGFAQSAASGAGFAQSAASRAGFAQSAASGAGFAQSASSDAGFAQSAASGANYTQPAASGAGFAQSAASGTGYTQPAASGAGFDQSAASGTGYTQPAASGAGFARSAASGAGYTQPAASADSVSDSAVQEEPQHFPEAPVLSQEERILLDNDPVYAEYLKAWRSQYPFLLNHGNIDMIDYWYIRFNHAADLIDYLIAYCDANTNGRVNSRYIGKVAMEWHKKGYQSAKEAEEKEGQRIRTAYAVMKALGLRKEPAPTEIDRVSKWLNDPEFGFSKEMILLACKTTIDTKHEPNFDYIEGILKNWRANSVTTPEEAAAERETHRKERAAEKKGRSKAGTRPAKNDQFNNFNQRDIDYNKLLLGRP